ncbi:MAG: M55 family metallopeptidase [Thermaerobacter sp.]|nr:M55 family metallopeptidase [Thermaerobacter sp.]
MNIWISVDMEGVGGIVDRDQLMPGRSRYEEGRDYMMGDLAVVVEQLRQAPDVDRIIVNDSHDGMVNVRWDALPAGVRLISGGGKPWSMNQGMAGADAAFFVGYHARAGTASAIADHTYAASIYALRINGLEVGETGLNAALAGHFGVPVAMVTGDDKVAEEARSLLPWVETAIVKHGVTRRAAELLARADTDRALASAVHRALAAVRERRSRIWVVPPPVTLEVTFLTSDMADRALYCPGSARAGGRTVVVTEPDMPEAFRAFYTLMALASQSGG